MYEVLSFQCKFQITLKAKFGSPTAKGTNMLHGGTTSLS